MSGPVTTVDVPAARVAPCAPDDACLELHESRNTTVEGMPVRRALPRRGRRTVGAWCFVDHLGPAQRGEDLQVEVGPHPHIGLQTVTWLLAGNRCTGTASAPSRAFGRAS